MPRRVEIRHPGYAAPNMIFSLPANDGPNRDHAHYATVLAGGAVFTECQGGIWLSKSSSGTPRVEGDGHGLIAAGEYYLHVAPLVSSDTQPYPVTANFRAWKFPSGALSGDSLPLWQQAMDGATSAESLSSPEIVTNESCRITNKRLACENAHIIPASEKAWFAHNEMDRYGQLFGRSGEAVADSSSNQMRLTRDAHWLWENLHFTIVPRENLERPGEVAWFTLMLIEGEELYLNWHFQEVQSLPGRAPEYLFARFAWSMFPKLHAFLQAGQPRRLSVRRSDGEVDIRIYSPDECRKFTLDQGRGRSASPTKRPRSEANEHHFDNGAGEQDIDESQNAHDSDTPSSMDSLDSAVAGLGVYRKTHDACDPNKDEDRGRTRIKR